MDVPRKIGIGIVMIVPTFVGSGALWALFHSFFPVIIWVALMALATMGIIVGKIPSGFRGASS